MPSRITDGDGEIIGSEHATRLPRRRWEVADERALQALRAGRPTLYVPPEGIFVWAGWPDADELCARCKHPETKHGPQEDEQAPTLGADGAVSDAAYPTRCRVPGCRCAAPRVDAYDPMEQIDEILREITALDVSSESALLAFVNRWGTLGLGLRENRGARWHIPFEAVSDTQHKLREIQSLAAGILRFRARRVRDDQAARQAVTTLNQHLASCTVRPALVVTRKGLVPQYRPGRLLDALYLGLWLWGFGEGKTLRRCAVCGGVFEVGVGNRKKQTCGETCKKRRQRARGRMKAKKERRSTRDGRRTTGTARAGGA